MEKNIDRICVEYKSILIEQNEEYYDIYIKFE